MAEEFKAEREVAKAALQAELRARAREMRARAGVCTPVLPLPPMPNP